MLQTLPKGFSPPVEWTDADYAQVKTSLAQAPYGVGTETVIDQSVRDALELTAASAAFDNAAEWHAELGKAISQVAAKLVPKLPVHAVTAQFYKMVRFAHAYAPEALIHMYNSTE